MLIRRFKIGDEPALRAVFFSSVHELTGGQYTPEQQQAWAPLEYDQDLWNTRIRGINPFVVDINGRVVGYADVQTSGYIDHFYVAAAYAGQGIGRTLMEHIHQVAKSLEMTSLWSSVSLTAEPFFLKRGFRVERRNHFLLRDVQMSNATMRKSLLA